LVAIRTTYDSIPRGFRLTHFTRRRLSHGAQMLKWRRGNAPFRVRRPPAP